MISAMSGAKAGEQQEPADVGVCDTFLFREVGDRLRLTALDSPTPLVRWNQRLDDRLVAAWLWHRHRRPVS
jgi:hypothetical protein